MHRSDFALNRSGVAAAIFCCICAAVARYRHAVEARQRHCIHHMVLLQTFDPQPRPAPQTRNESDRAAVVDVTLYPLVPPVADSAISPAWAMWPQSYSPISSIAAADRKVADAS